MFALDPLKAYSSFYTSFKLPERGLSKPGLPEAGLPEPDVPEWGMFYSSVACPSVASSERDGSCISVTLAMLFFVFFCFSCGSATGGA